LAIADCTESIHRDASNAVAYFDRARAYQAIGEQGRAAADLARAKRLKADIDGHPG
jgi:hypothetical protein